MTSILFDLDGTIADSVPVIIKTAIKTCADFGITINENDIKELIGVPLLVQGEKLLGKGRGEEYKKAYQDVYLNSDDCGNTFDGMIEILYMCKELGLKTAIVTSKSSEGADFLLQGLNIKKLFDVIVTANSGCGFKPEAGPALFALEKMDEKPQNSLFIGDSTFDILCGKNAGTHTCAVFWGAGKKEALLAETPDYTAASVKELQDIILSFAQNIHIKISQGA